jgi:hypothetical protein
MGNNWESDKRKTDGVMRHVRAALGGAFVKDATPAEDQTEATDLKTLILGSETIAVRIRDDSYRAKYGHEITLRADRPSGAKSELQKIMCGYSQWFFYGFANYETMRLTQYVLINTNGIREYLWDSRDVLAIFYESNIDNSSNFLPIEISSLPAWSITKQWPRPIDNNQGGRFWTEEANALGVRKRAA